MEWLAGNWFWILLAIAFIVMHLFGHGGHGGHGGQEDNRNEIRPQKPSGDGSGHHHH